MHCLYCQFQMDFGVSSLYQMVSAEFLLWKSLNSTVLSKRQVEICFGVTTGPRPTFSSDICHWSQIPEVVGSNSGRGQKKILIENNITDTVLIEYARSNGGILLKHLTVCYNLLFI